MVLGVTHTHTYLQIAGKHSCSPFFFTREPSMQYMMISITWNRREGADFFIVAMEKANTMTCNLGKKPNMQVSSSFSRIVVQVIVEHAFTVVAFLITNRTSCVILFTSTSRSTTSPGIFSMRMSITRRISVLALASVVVWTFCCDWELAWAALYRWTWKGMKDTNLLLLLYLCVKGTTQNRWNH